MARRRRGVRGDAGDGAAVDDEKEKRNFMVGVINNRTRRPAGGERGSRAV
jgi:hypothetical protein